MKSLRKHRVILLFIIDIIIICLAYMLSAFLLINNKIIFSSEYNTLISNSIIITVVTYQIIFNAFGVYKNIIRYEDGKDYIKYIVLSAFSGIIIFLINFIFNLPLIGYKQTILANIFIPVAMISYRVVIRFMLTNGHSIGISKKDRKNLLIIGAGEAAKDIIKALNNSSIKGRYNLVGLIDDNPNKIGYTISGEKILGDRNKI